MNMFLPPLAYLAEVLEGLREVSNLLDRALIPIKRFKRVREDELNDLHLAIAFHGLNAVEESRALMLLAENKLGGPLYAHARSLFEILVKVRWMRQDPKRATAYLDSEPFERYALASPAVKVRPVFKQVVQDCKMTIKNTASLLQLPGVINKNGKPSFRKIAVALRMPALDKMAKTVGLDSDDYMLDFGISSLAPHSSIIHTKDFGKHLNSDGTVTVSAEIPPGMLLSYVARAIPRVGQILQEMLLIFPDGAIEFETEKAVKRGADLVAKLKTVP